MKRTQNNTYLTGTLTLDFSLYNCGKINFCCSRPTIYSILLWQPSWLRHYLIESWQGLTSLLLVNVSLYSVNQPLRRRWAILTGLKVRFSPEFDHAYQQGLPMGPSSCLTLIPGRTSQGCTRETLSTRFTVICYHLPSMVISRAGYQKNLCQPSHSLNHGWWIQQKTCERRFPCVVWHAWCCVYPLSPAVL